MFICQGKFNPEVFKESLGLSYYETVCGSHNFEYCYIKVQQKRAEQIEKAFMEYDYNVPESMRINLMNLPGQPKLIGFGFAKDYKKHAIYKEIKQQQQQGCSSYMLWQNQGITSVDNHNDVSITKLAKGTSRKRKSEDEEEAEILCEHKRELAAEERDLRIREKLMEYVYGDCVTRLTMRPTLHRLLQPQYPDGPTRTKFIESLAINLNHQAVEYAGVYVLKLTGLPYTHYVGTSRTVLARIEQHRRGVGAGCTTAATQIESLPLLTKGSIDDLDSWERTETLALMYTIGIDKVRGWHYTDKVHSDEDRRHIYRNICSYNMLCHRCGFGSHMVTKCYARRCSYWMGGGLL